MAAPATSATTSTWPRTSPPAATRTWATAPSPKSCSSATPADPLLSRRHKTGCRFQLTPQLLIPARLLRLCRRQRRLILLETAATNPTNFFRRRLGLFHSFCFWHFSLLRLLCPPQRPSRLTRIPIHFVVQNLPTALHFLNPPAVIRFAGSLRLWRFELGQRFLALFLCHPGNVRQRLHRFRSHDPILVL